MFKKIRDLLGIEGAKIDIVLLKDFNINDKVINGEVIVTSQTDKLVKGLSIKLIEKYKRGRKESLLVDEYTLGEIDLDLLIPVLANQTERIEFSLPFNRMLSDMDKIGKANPINAVAVKLAKKLKGVKSEYRIEAVAQIQGTKLNPVIIKRFENSN